MLNREQYSFPHPTTYQGFTSFKRRLTEIWEYMAFFTGQPAAAKTCVPIPCVKEDPRGACFVNRLSIITNNNTSMDSTRGQVTRFYLFTSESSKSMKSSSIPDNSTATIICRKRHRCLFFVHVNCKINDRLFCKPLTNFWKFSSIGRFPFSGLIHPISYYSP